jgi:hypothetical protein
MLAQAIFLTKYMKHSLNDTTWGKIEQAWLRHWRAQLGKPSCTPRTVMRAYLDSMDITMEDLDAQMSWECWPEDDEPFGELDLSDSE